jgi:hypothetical protein
VNEQRRHVLQMLADGKITADEAERLITAVERDQPESPAGAAPRGKPRPRYLRVVMNSEDTSGGEGPTRINVRVPLQLLRAGVRLASLLPPQALTQINAQLTKSGVPIDLTQLKPQHIEDLVEQLDDLTVDLDEPGTTLKVFCE